MEKNMYIITDENEQVLHEEGIANLVEEKNFLLFDTREEAVMIAKFQEEEVEIKEVKMLENGLYFHPNLNEKGDVVYTSVVNERNYFSTDKNDVAAIEVPTGIYFTGENYFYVESKTNFIDELKTQFENYKIEMEKALYMDMTTTLTNENENVKIAIGFTNEGLEVDIITELANTKAIELAEEVVNKLKETSFNTLAKVTVYPIEFLKEVDEDDIFTDPFAPDIQPLFHKIYLLGFEGDLIKGRITERMEKTANQKRQELETILKEIEDIQKL